MKKIAQRLGVRESDVIRFAVKSMLSRLAPLHDPEARGRSLVPVFATAGAEFLRFFDLDVMRLDSIINEGVMPPNAISHEDIALLAMADSSQAYAALRPNDAGGAETGRGERRPEAIRLQDYFYEKYVLQRAIQDDATDRSMDRPRASGDDG